jgi:hypothetical protein
MDDPLSPPVPVVVMGTTDGDQQHQDEQQEVYWFNLNWKKALETLA